MGPWVHQMFESELLSSNGPGGELLLSTAGDILRSLDIWDLVFLIPSLLLMGIMFTERGKYSQLVRGLGTLLFAGFWFTQVLLFLEDDHWDPVNAIMSMLGGVFFLFISAHFVLDHIWKERTRSLEWLLRVSLLTGGSYFIFEHIPITQGISIYVVAWLTYLTLRLFGNRIGIEAGIPLEVDHGLLIMPDDTRTMPISIVFACTAALSILLFSYAALVTKMNRAEWEPWARKEMGRLRDRGSLLARSKVHGLRNLLRMTDAQRKTRAIVIVVLLIFFTNVFRNVGVIAMVYDGHMSFDLAHGFYAKALSLVMMLFLTWVLFEHLPELQEDLMGLVDLTKRVKKGMIVNGRLDLKYVAAPKKKGD